MRPDIDAVAAQAWDLIDAGDVAEASRLLVHAVHSGIAAADMFAAGTRVRRHGPVIPPGRGPMHLRHPDLDQVIETPDNPAQAEVLAKAGWEPYEPPRTTTSPAYVPGHEPPATDDEPTEAPAKAPRRSRQTTDQATQED